MTDNKRREFLKLSLTLTSGLVLSGAGSTLTGCASGNTKAARDKAFGIQLYTLRDDMPKDPKGVLKQLASFGYKQIESYEHETMGMFWGMKSTEFNKYLDDLGMKLVASHADINKDFERKAAETAALGIDYLICPWLGPQKSLDAYKKSAVKFNQCGEICKKNGIRFAYHNHDYSFQQLQGQFPQDVLMNETNKDTVDYEMDIYWVVTAGQDPVTWLKKHPNRFRLFHIKDRIKNAPLSEKEASTDVGKGSIDFPAIIDVASKEGKRYFLLEQERYDGTTPLKAAQAGAAYMRSKLS